MAVRVPAQYQGWVNTAARNTGLPPALVAAQINMESGFNPKVTSPAGAQGIAQFMPGTWASNAPRGSSPFDPNASLQAYSKLMGTLVRQYGGNVRNALAAYNAGPGNLGAGMGYANSILSSAGQPASRVSPPATAAPAAGGAPQVTQSTQFDQAAFDKANRAAIAGKFLADSARSVSMWQTGPKSSVPSGANLFGPGLLTTTAPSRSDYTTTHYKVAQSSLQGLAGGTGLNVHPSASGHVNFAPQASVGVQPITIATLKEAAAGIGKPLYVGTGKVGHSTYTVNGNVSEHSTGHAADLIASDSGMSNEQLGQSLYRYFTGSKQAPAGGLFNIQWQGHRIQLIYQTMEGGNHFTHVHLGIR